jgi:hypothetical protein
MVPVDAARGDPGLQGAAPNLLRDFDRSVSTTLIGGRPHTLTRSENFF